MERNKARYTSTQALQMIMEESDEEKEAMTRQVKLTTFLKRMSYHHLLEVRKKQKQLKSWEVTIDGKVEHAAEVVSEFGRGSMD